MLTRTMWILLGVFSLVIAEPYQWLPAGSGLALAKDRDGGAGGGNPMGGGGPAASVARESGGGSTSDNNDPLSAFVTSPVFARVAPPVLSTVAASSLFASRVGLLCQTMTQTINIDGQSVHASALLCRQPDGTWRIITPEDDKSGTATRRPGPTSRASAVAKV